jgi:putative spermidine/putrescine transport system ATP-binding protein
MSDRVVVMEQGRVSRFFLGSSWFFNVETSAGLIGVSVPNVGDEPDGEGDAVALDWSPSSARAEMVGLEDQPA